MAKTASELEVELNALIGRFPGWREPRYPDIWEMIKRNTKAPDAELAHQQQINVENAQSLIRQWLIAKGVEEKLVWASTMTPYVMANAYRAADAYIPSIGKDDSKKRTPGTRGARPMPVDLLNQVEPVEAPQQVYVPQPAQISDAQVKRVVDSLVAEKLDAAQRQMSMLRGNLQTDINNSIRSSTQLLREDVESMVEKLELGQHMTDQISTLAVQAAQDAATKMLPHRIELRFPNGDIKNLGADIRHEKFERVLKWLIAGCHVYIVGQKGTGKTHMAEQLRDAMRLVLNRPDYEVRFIDQSLTKYDVKGFKGPDGKYIGTLVRDCVENGWLMFIDEGDMWAAAALGALNSILANNVGSFPDNVVKVHKDFRCVLAANTTGHGATAGYVGRQPLDIASLDRFRYVTMGYDKNMERQLYGGQNDAWLEFVWRLRDACHEAGNPELEPSMRAIDAGLKGLAVGLTVDEVMDDVIWKGAAQDKINKVLNHAGQPPKQRSPIREVA